LLNRVDTITDLNYVANYDRIDRWTAAWHIWQDHPIAGVGWGSYPDVYFDYQTDLEAFSREERMGAHNLYLEIMAETGIIGITVFLFLIYMFFRETFIVFNMTRSRFRRVFIIGAQGAMITYLFHTLVNNLGPSDKIAITFWFLLGIMPALRALAEKENKPPSPKQPQPESTGSA
jgi:O-antigen ligase